MEWYRQTEEGRLSKLGVEVDREGLLGGWSHLTELRMSRTCQKT